MKIRVVGTSCSMQRD